MPYPIKTKPWWPGGWLVLAACLGLAHASPTWAASPGGKTRSWSKKLVVRAKWATRPIRHRLAPLGRRARAAGKSMGQWLHTKARRLGRTKLARSRLGQFAAGLLIDGPKDSWRAIKENPKVFAYGLLATGAIAVTGGALGLPMHGILVGASALAAGVEVVQIHQHEYKETRGSKARARIAGKMAWLPALVVASAVGGAAVEGHGEATGAVTVTTSAARLTLGSALRAFTSGIVTAGDVPTSAVTAYQSWKEEQRQLRRPR